MRIANPAIGPELASRFPRPYRARRENGKVHGPESSRFGKVREFREAGMRGSVGHGTAGPRAKSKQRSMWVRDDRAVHARAPDEPVSARYTRARIGRFDEALTGS